jgi:hypothetical protein
MSLLHFDYAANDEIGKSWTAANGAAISASQSKFGSGSLYLNGVNQCLSATNTFNIATIDCWFYRTATATKIEQLYTFSPTTEIAYAYTDSSGYLKIKFQSTDIITSLTTIPNNAWTHFAVTWDGSKVCMYIDGTLQGSYTDATITFSPSTFYIGSSTTSNAWTGYIDEFRISNIVRWTGNFTPSSVAYDMLASSSPSALVSRPLSILDTKYFPINYAIDNNCQVRFLASVNMGAGVTGAEIRCRLTASNGTTSATNECTLTYTSSGILQGYVDFPSIIAPTVKIDILGRLLSGSGTVTLNHWEAWLEL